MTNSQLLISFLIIFLVTKQPVSLLAILSGQQQDSVSNEQQNATIVKPDGVANPTLAGNVESAPKESPSRLDANSTFYYDADAFLINQKVDSNGNKNDDHEQSSSKQQSKNATQEDAASEKKRMVPADSRLTSARNGRMLDLDALVGDFETSKANKERQLMSGNRQSRFLQQSAHLDVAGGKRLHIKGFIPIVGVGDDPADDDSEQADQIQASSTKQRPKVSNNIDLPYGQSSIGHASFGVQRYSNSDDQFNQQLIAPKFASGGTGATTSSSSSMLDSLKKPIKKLANFASANNPLTTNEISLNRIGSQLQPQQQQLLNQNCHCVPFYMCKNGFINESSLGKSQIQQLISQQQQQQLTQQPRQIDQLNAMRRGSVASVPVQVNQQQQPKPSIADPYSLIDERSFESDIVTAPSMPSEGGSSFANETLGMLSDSFLAMETLTSTTTSTTTTQAPPSTSEQQQLMLSSDLNSDKQNATTDQQLSEQANDYSQEILGRMLGLKSSNGKLGGDAQPASAGACGLLRTCCTLITTQQQQQLDSMNSRKSFGQSNFNNNLKQQQQQSVQLFNQQALEPTAANQRYAQQFQQLPYGLPVPQQISQRMQPAMNYQMQHSNSLVHRSNQYTSQPLQTQAVNQYTRVATQMQPLQSFQQQQQQQQQSPFSPHTPMMKSWPMSSQVGLAAAAATTLLQTQTNHQLGNGGGGALPMNQNIGTRKLLDGRCGLRQSAGITGRVQNLQYHENSADFGEYPAQAAILKRLNGSESLFVCGGTLISQYWVATAAHCIRKHSQSDLKVRLGEWDVNRDDEFYPFVEKEIRDVVVHSEFVSGNLVNDIALLRLDSPVDSSLPHVNPACLPTIDETFTRQRCWVTGWGKDSFGQKGSFQSVLNEVELPVIGHGECEQALRQTRLGPHYRLHSGFICAGGEGGKDACEGDGGSGLYCYQDGLLKVAGLVSWGIGCGQQGVPGVYVNMAHYRPWIENIISIDEDVYSKNSASVTTTPPSAN